MMKTCFTVKDEGSILNEFFMEFIEGSVKGVKLSVFRRKLLGAVGRIIENEGLVYGDDEKGLRTHFFTCILMKYLQKAELPASLKLNRNLKRFMKRKVFRKIYLCAVSILFSQEYQKISEILGVRCCVGRVHFSFCRQKWEELNRFAQVGLLKMLNVKFVSSLKGTLVPIEEDTDTLYAN